MTAFITHCAALLRRARRFRLLALAVGYAVIAGCAGVFDSRPAEEIVADRAAKHLSYLQAQEWGRALKFTTPAFRSVTTSEQYAVRYRGAGGWLESRVGEVSCDAPDYNVCNAATYVTTRQPMYGMSNERYRPRKWIKSGNQWFIYEPMQ